jgi:ribosomal protein L35
VPRKPKAKGKGKLKLKTHKATSKRFSLTGSGKVVRTKGGKSHLRRRRSARSGSSTRCCLCRAAASSSASAVWRPTSTSNPESPSTVAAVGCRQRAGVHGQPAGAQGTAGE